MASSFRAFSLFLLATLLLSGAAFAQVTGGITGRVVGSDGSGLPGVTVEATSPSLQGSRTAVTDYDGSYRLLLLPPGQYSVSWTLSGFIPQKRPGITVYLGRDTAIDITLKVGMAEDITVSAAAPLLDTQSTTLGTNFTTQSIETLPTGRNYSSIVQVAPGILSDATEDNSDQSKISVYGSSGAENAFYVDGVNTTNLEYGFQGKELNFEFIQEVQVKTGGYEAEFGRSTGGIINVITKSGGNTFSGDIFGYYDTDSLQSNPKSVTSTGGTGIGFTKKDYGLDLGGYLIKDKLWFFAAYDKVSHDADIRLPVPFNATTVTSTSKRDLGSGKLTYNLTNNQTLVASFLQDPRDDTGAINDANHKLNGTPVTYSGLQNFGGRDYALRYDGVFASNWLASAQVARHREANSVGPSSSAGDAIEYRDAANDFRQTGGFGLIQSKEFKRDFYGASIARFFGGHQIKFGTEYEKETADVSKRMSGGQQVDIFANSVNPAKPIYRHFYWTTPDATLANAPLSALNVSPSHRNTTAYLQDSWSARPNLQINAGVRWDRQEIIDASGIKQIDMKKDFAPRLGVTWDPGNDHRAKIYGSFGRYYEQIPMDLVIRSFSYERQPRIINYDPTSIVPNSSAEADFGTVSAILGGFTEPADPNIKNQYLNEFILGGERELLPHISFGVKGIYRSYGNVIEDFLCADDGTYCIGNPGKGIMKEIFTLDYSQTFPAPEAKRTYKGVQFDATKALNNNWQGMASYIFSKLDGNYDGEYAPFTNIGADPNISAAYDYYDFFTNGSDLTKITNRGPLSNDRRHQFKASGTYFSPWKLSVGVSAYWRSGTPLTRYGYSDAYSRYEFFLTTRGAEGRSPATYEADVHLGYPIEVGRTKINILLDVFNLLNAQRPILVDQRWGFQESDNALATPANTNYGRAVLRTPPTSARLGLRVSF
jgi:hypothetical protein